MLHRKFLLAAIIPHGPPLVNIETHNFFGRFFRKILFFNIFQVNENNAQIFPGILGQNRETNQFVPKGIDEQEFPDYDKAIIL